MDAQQSQQSSNQTNFPGFPGNNQPPTPFMFFFTPFFFPPQEAQHPHVSDAAMKKLPIITITQEHIDSKASCPICLEQLPLTEVIKGKTQKPIRQMPCKHIFCESCLFTWLKQNNTCPLCRYEIKNDLQSRNETPTPDIAQNNNNTQNNIMTDSTTDSSEVTNSHHPNNSNNSNNSHTFVSCELAHVGCCGEDSHTHNPIISLPRCHHKFHASCLRTSLTIEGYSIDSSLSSSLEFFCPTCRAPSILQSDMLKLLENNSEDQNDQNDSRIINAIKSVNVPGGWKVVVVDDHSLKVIESTCTTFDILEEKVTLVENLHKPRQPNPNFDAVYIITPSPNSVEKVIEDFTRQKPPLYAGAHLFFLSPLDDPIFQRLRSSLPPNFFKSFEILYIDFHGEENPLIRFQRGIDSDHPTKALPFKLAQLVQAEFDDYARNKKRVSPPQDIQRPRAILFIVDRSIDMYTPILHEFTYQAMANDVLQLENGKKFTYNYVGADGSNATKDAILDESDTIWVDIRHKHMKDCIDQLMTDFNKFLEENSTITNKYDDNY
ncbi:15159_t:CDS:2 [Gigaspora margarita]|uniref:15159_t:CDS:1 n=1 Tax=Gigaspora margarita TaxID=4874 RepID=A0ABN7UG98_GIGMA|nr:15159_t:CDS:2 [Gigaspora margarita]